MSSSPLVSVIVATYNMADTLGEALASLLAQTHPRLEVLVMDDGSIDHTREVVTQMRAQPRGECIVYHHHANQGKVATLNWAYGLATGDYVTLLDADDTLPPDSVALRAQVLERNPDAVAVYGDAHYMDLQGRPYRLRRSREVRRASQLVGSLMVPVIGATLMARRWVIQDMGGLDPGLKRSEDAQLNMEVFRRGAMLYLSQSVYNYRNYDRPDNLALRILSIKSDCRIIAMYYRGPARWWYQAKKLLGGGIKLLFELVSNRK